MIDINNFEIEETFGFIINRASIILRKRLTILLKEKGIDITPEEFSFLSRLWEENGITQSLLVEKTIKDKALVTRQLNNLIKKGYIYKEVKIEDRRSQVIFLTEEGHLVKEIIVPIVMKLMKETSKDIDEEELIIARKVIKQMYINLDDY